MISAIVLLVLTIFLIVLNIKGGDSVEDIEEFNEHDDCDKVDAFQYWGVSSGAEFHKNPEIEENKIANHESIAIESPKSTDVVSEKINAYKNNQQKESYYLDELKKDIEYWEEREGKWSEILAKELEDSNYNVMISSICEKLKQMNLYDKLYETELENTYPLFKTRYAKVDDINKNLHKVGKEVTYNEDYYILVEPGTHEERIKALATMKISPHQKVNFPQEDRSNGRIASGSDEDNYDDDFIPAF